jgi:hypothetical protein
VAEVVCSELDFVAVYCFPWGNSHYSRVAHEDV